MNFARRVGRLMAFYAVVWLAGGIALAVLHAWFL